MSEYARGSEWRRWDLHVHTASSYDYDYNGMDSDELLANALIDNELVAVAITDHFVISKKRIESLRRLAPQIVFFPGVELRTDKGDTNIHVILIFSPNIDLDKLVESFNVFKREKGKESDKNERVYWDYKEIINFAAQHEALISIHAGSKTSGVDHKISNKLDHSQAVKEDYAKTVHIFEMGKLEDINDYKINVFPNIGERPLVICSDNHDPRIYKPKEKLWIKADPTFNGLKQIVYEPLERVCVSDITPEQKPDYLVIDRVEIYNEGFQNTPIYFNNKLNCIIGGKSTGKSILLHNLALSLDRKQVEDKDVTSQTRTKKDVKMSVYWVDGKGGENAISNERKIIYIPQTYLNKLCDEQTEKTEIDTIIQEIVLLNDDARRTYDATALSIKNYKPDVSKTLLDLIGIHNEINGIIAKMKELGDKESIKAERDKLIKEKELLTKDSSLTEEEVNEYEDATMQTAVLARKIQEIDDELSAINAITSVVEPKHIDDYRFSERTKTAIVNAQKNILEKSNEEWKSSKDKLVEFCERSKDEKLEKYHEYSSIETDLKDKIQSNKAISELTTKITTESERLAMFEQLETVKKEKEQKKETLLRKAVSSKDFYEKQHITLADAINNNSNLKTEDLQFSVEVPFRKDAFIDKLKTIMDTGRKIFKDVVAPDSFTVETYTSDKISELVENILSGELILKNKYTPETALRDILDDWFEVKYKVTMGDDSIDVMSPGKKALVLLKLLIELAQSKCPILIDQPEDDLDNRSIFDELIPFIKRKKKDRQIIVVTHNANIVLGADAEEVIVANQKGKNAPNKDFRFEYRSGSIENDLGTADKYILYSQGIQQHICDILEGGKEAFTKRKHKYHM